MSARHLLAAVWEDAENKRAQKKKAKQRYELAMLANDDEAPPYVPAIAVHRAGHAADQVEAKRSHTGE